MKDTKKWKFFNYMSKPQNSCRTLPQPRKVKNYPKIKSKSKVRIERKIENESCSTIWVDLKTVVAPYSNPKISPLGPQKVKKKTKIKSKSKVRIEWNIENENDQLQAQTPKQLWNPIPTPNPIRAQKSQNDQKIKSNFKGQNWKKHKSCSTTWLDPKQFLILTQQ